MKVVAVSDLHGNLPNLPTGDLLVIAGDVCPPPYFPEYQAIPLQIDWLKSKFNSWIETHSKKFKKIVGIAGNHDVALEHFTPHLNWTYLRDSGTNFMNYSIWGTPWTRLPFEPWPFEWAFRKNEDEQKEIFSRIPLNTDILITHGPPLGILDLTVQGVHAGSNALRLILPRLNFKLHVFGHIHEAFGKSGKCFNVSYVSESLKPRWLEIDLD